MIFESSTKLEIIRINLSTEHYDIKYLHESFNLVNSTAIHINVTLCQVYNVDFINHIVISQ